MRWLDNMVDSMEMNKLRDNEGEGSLVYCSPWGSKESDTTEQLNNNKNILILSFLCQKSFKSTVLSTKLKTT